jgi:hypothetical protein
MAKQAGPFFFTGTIGDVIFYKLGDQYYIRMKGDYNKKRMQKPGAYPLMQLKQAEFGQASKLASQVYRLLPRAHKKQGLFGQFTRAARKLLKEGKTHEDVVAMLTQRYLQPLKVVKQEKGQDVSQKPIYTVEKQQAITKQPTCSKRLSITYRPQYKQNALMSDLSKQVGAKHKNRKLKWPAITTILLE